MKTNKKELAQILYCEQNKTQQEIADLLGVSQQNISAWATKGKWSDLKIGVSVSRRAQICHLYRQMEDINAAILKRPEGQRTATADEANILFTLSKSINNIENEIGISEIVNTGMAFCDWLKDNEDLETAKNVCNLWDGFLNSRLR